MPGPLVVAQRGLGQERHLGVVVVGPEIVQRVDVLDPLQQPHRGRSHGHRPDRLLVAVVADVEHGVALAGPDPQLVVDLGNEGADGVDHHPPAGPGGATTSGADPWADSMSGAPAGTSSTSSTKITPWARNWSTTWRLWTISW